MRDRQKEKGKSFQEQRKRKERNEWVKSDEDQITWHRSAQNLLRAEGLQDGSGGELHLSDESQGWVDEQN